MTVPPLPRLIMEPALGAALREDLGIAGDVTSRLLFRPGTRATAIMRTRQPGIACGLAAAALAFELLDPAVEIDFVVEDGDSLDVGDAMMGVRGEAAAILAAERTAVNFAQRLSGIATAARCIVDCISHTKSKLLCTRKTTPSLRAFEKHAVRAGGGLNHRFGLFDGVLIKDNHLALLDGDVSEALRRVRSGIGHMTPVQVEVDRFEQLESVLASGLADAVLLDNMTPTELAAAVGLVGGALTTEASGQVRPDRAAAIAESGVDYLSSGWISHSAPALDIGLDFE